MNILVFGDSITQGFHDTIHGGWCNLLQTEAIRRTIESDFKKELAVFNLGISGNNSENLLARFEHESASRSEEELVIVFAIGINDSLCVLHTGGQSVALEKFKENIKTLVQQAQAISRNIYIVGLTQVIETEVNPLPWKVGYGYSNKIIQSYDSVLESIAKTTGTHFIPMFDVWGHTVSEYLSDGLHPNVEGHEKIYERVRDTFVKDNIL